MPINLRAGEGGRFTVIQAFGRLAKEDYGFFTAEFERLVREQGRLRILFDITGLQGWEPGALWEEVKFDLKHFSEIERLAVLGNREWQQVLTAISKPFTRAETRYFESSH